MADWKKPHYDIVIICDRTIHEEPETIRGMFALTDTRNCVHGSGWLSPPASTVFEPLHRSQLSK